MPRPTVFGCLHKLFMQNKLEPHSSSASECVRNQNPLYENLTHMILRTLEESILLNYIVTIFIKPILHGEVADGVPGEVPGYASSANRPA
jgi:hypothetical protein